ncbi:MAG: hypothetical protein LBL60_02750 [Mycoplasmataceae bacterium]|nr:hypothetical protein [Mycoplasmataceae bacterium]
MEWIKQTLETMNIKCGVIHNPSKYADPNYFRFFISSKSYKDFIKVIGSFHPRKKEIFLKRDAESS